MWNSRLWYLTHGSLLTTQTVHSCQKSRTCAMDTVWICGPRDNHCQQVLAHVSINCLVLRASLHRTGAMAMLPFLCVVLVTHWVQYECGSSFSFCNSSSVQFIHSVVSDSLRPHGLQPARLPCPSPTPRVMSIASVMPSNHLILCRPLLLYPSIFPSIRVFSNESVLHIRWPKYWS